MAVGTTTVDFGAFPGKADASAAVIGQASIVAGSAVEAWVRPVATVDHSADEHMVEGIRFAAADIAAGTGFTIYAFENSVTAPGPQAGRDMPPNYGGNEGHRLYGLWTVNWAWV